MASFLRLLRCARCGEAHDAAIEQHLCAACGGPLLAEYDLQAIAATVRPEDLAGRERSMWRYREFLPLSRFEQRVSLGESWTPLLEVPRLAGDLGLPGLLVKDEGLLPTGSFKARGAAVGVSRARELGARVLALPTAGNAGGAWAAYGARAGLKWGGDTGGCATDQQGGVGGDRRASGGGARADHRRGPDRCTGGGPPWLVRRGDAARALPHRGEENDGPGAGGVTWTGRSPRRSSTRAAAGLG